MQWDEILKKNWTPNSTQMCISGHPILKSWLKPCVGLFVRIAILEYGKFQTQLEVHKYGMD